MTSKIPAQLPVMSCQKPFLFQIPYCASNYPGFSSSSLPRKIRRWQRVDELVSFSMLTSSHYFVSTRINMPVCDKPLALGQDLEGWGNLSKMGLLSILITLEGSLPLSRIHTRRILEGRSVSKSSSLPCGIGFFSFFFLQSHLSFVLLISEAKKDQEDCCNSTRRYCIHTKIKIVLLERNSNFFIKKN